MKYTKKVPYFKEGDKIDKAARNLPKKQKEAVLKVSSAQKEQERKDKLSSVGAGFKKPTARVEGPKTSQASKIKPVEKKPVKPAAKTRGEAFQQARKRGDSEFLWQGKRYHTRTAEEEAKRKANADKTSAESARTDVPEQNSAIERPSAEVEQSTSPWTTLPGITRPVTSRYGYITQGPAAESITNRQQHAIDVSRLPEIHEEAEPAKVG